MCDDNNIFVYIHTYIYIYIYLNKFMKSLPKSTPSPTPNTQTRNDQKEKQKDNKTEKVFRGPIPGSSYYIVNELVSGENTKIFSAVKMNSNEVEDLKYSVKYYSKSWIKSEVLSKLKYPDDKVKKFFDTIKSSINDFKAIKHDNIQELIDYFDDEEGIFIVYEFCEWTLKDYLTILREPLKYSKIPFETKIRKYIHQILDAVKYLHENNSLAFGGLLNSHDIMISETVQSDVIYTSTSVKMPHPFLSNFITILKIYDVEAFPSFYAPEVFARFKQDEILKAIENKDTFDMGTLLSKINQNFDMWSLGYLLYEMIFENPPFVFEDLNKALNTLSPKYTYQINPYSVSVNVLKIINQCLQYDPNKRIQSFFLIDLTEEIKKENEIGEDFDALLKERSNMKNSQMKDESERFNLNDYSYDKYI